MRANFIAIFGFLLVGFVGSTLLMPGAWIFADLFGVAALTTAIYTLCLRPITTQQVVFLSVLIAMSSALIVGPIAW